MIKLHAQPYDISAAGFYFETAGEYDTKAAANKNDYGELVEEYEIQFIDGDLGDAAFADAWGLNQANLRKFLEVAEDWHGEDKIRFIVAVGECGYSFDPDTVTPDDFDVDIIPEESMKDLAERFVDDGLFGDISPTIINYIDYDAIARDLEMDYSSTEIAGQRFIYRCL